MRGTCGCAGSTSPFGHSSHLPHVDTSHMIHTLSVDHHHLRGFPPFKGCTPLTGYIGVMTSWLTVLFGWWPASQQWGGGAADGVANRVHWSDDQLANSVVWVMTSQLTMGWWGWWGGWQGTLEWWPVGQQCCLGGDQPADNGVVGLMGWPTGYIGMMINQLTVGWCGWWGSQQGTLEWWPVSWQWGGGAEGVADGVVWVMTTWLTMGWGGRQGMLEWWPVGWQWGGGSDGGADSVSRSDYQSANSSWFSCVEQSYW